MATSPAKDIASYLDTSGVGTEGTDIIVGQLIDSPDAQVACLDSPGGGNPNPKWARDFPRVQVIIRGDINDYSGAWDKAISVQNALLGAQTQTLNSKDYVSFRQIGNITLAGYDQKRRPMFSTNWQLVVDHNSNIGNRESF